MTPAAFRLRAVARFSIGPYRRSRLLGGIAKSRTESASNAGCPHPGLPIEGGKPKRAGSGCMGRRESPEDTDILEGMVWRVACQLAGPHAPPRLSRNGCGFPLTSETASTNAGCCTSSTERKSSDIRSDGCRRTIRTDCEGSALPGEFRDPVAGTGLIRVGRDEPEVRCPGSSG